MKNKRTEEVCGKRYVILPPCLESDIECDASSMKVS